MPVREDHKWRSQRFRKLVCANIDLGMQHHSLNLALTCFLSMMDDRAAQRRTSGPLLHVYWVSVLVRVVDAVQLNRYRTISVAEYDRVIRIS